MTIHTEIHYKEKRPSLQNFQALLDSTLLQFPSLDADAFLQKAEKLIDKLLPLNQVQELYNQLILDALNHLTENEPDWTYVASRLLAHKLQQDVCHIRKTVNPYTNLYQLIEALTEQGIYHSQLLESYSLNEIQQLESVLQPKRDHLFTYIGLKTLSDRYLTRDHSKQLWELPQERFMIIAMTLMRKEQTNRLQYVKEAYWALSNLYMTVATPTFANAGKTYGQLSSCFIDTVDDSLQGIYDSNTDIANLSKSGGGIGVYLGKIRSRGSDIRGFKGVSSGVIPWMKQLNNTAVSVDQLGQRKGAISVYLDVWHKDIFSFLDSKLNNGDERMRTHDLFNGVCIPDIFMEQVEKRGDWYLFDPHEVRSTMGYSLEDSFDEVKGAGSFRIRYAECVNHPDLAKEKVAAIDIMKAIMRGQLETGSPFIFYRDEVNRMNPNHHKGMIYCTNLCTEITQNQSATVTNTQFVKDGSIITVKTPGDFVVCNLSSINLARAVKADVLERLVPIQVRMLDNVIDLNDIPVLQAKMTNEKYRAVGLGTFGWHHLLALEGIKWESEKAVKYANELYEKIAFYTIQASALLGKEKGAYPAFEGSDWQTGRYFSKRNYDSQAGLDWEVLQKKVATTGIRNGYLMAVAPNATTSIIAGSTASIDPIFLKVYSEEKKDYKIPVTAPDLNAETNWFYKSAYHIDQHWSIAQNAARQKHIDQAISFNLYVTNAIKAKALLDLHLDAWKQGLKTTYYVRSTSTDIEECDSCAS
ncbi:ribonucleotide-diphosphate reductase subunit alpha [Bacillus sp. LL01]|uniref:ribonucleoside-diphosphate reductase subunit alpha n=1 Tax=Bacillus sp. LL01 TaxID=1665556 RepID=UPI00064D335D|nr:ribonucleoside-diphosphate reductase subunit alpha [Bacillus sp. LL01]KMJ57979.1 ribonucleotide-diphosphate reductase subunit alpha [Bacillus sp. LL01]